MALMNLGSGLKGLSYVIKIKLTSNQDWCSPDAIYAIGYKDSSRFRLMDLKSVVDDMNGAFCLSFKVSDG